MTDNLLSLDALQVVDAIARKGSFAAAAASLYRVPSALTYTVQKLEQDLAIQIFVKKGRKAQLTPAGQLLLERGRDILAATEQLVLDVKELHGGWESQLNIGIDTSFGVAAATADLQALMQQRPEIQLDVSEFVLNGAWEALINETIDIAIGVPEKPKDINAVHVFPLIEDDWVFAIAADHPLAAHQQPINQVDISQYRQVIIKDQANTLRLKALRQLNSSKFIKVENLQAKIAMQLAGLAIGFLPRRAIQHELATGALLIKPLDSEMAALVSKSQLYVAVRHGDRGRALEFLLNSLLNH